MVICFLPTRTSSVRVPNKNRRDFAGNPGGLTDVKLHQLVNCRILDRIIFSTDDPQALADRDAWADRSNGRVRVIERPNELASPSTSTSDLILHARDLLADYEQDDIVVWTHVTSPFFDELLYEGAITAFRRARVEGTHDSLATARRIQEFVWSSDGPINYDRGGERWPRTQDLSPLWCLDSAAFIAPVSCYRYRGDRLGERPVMYETEWPHFLDVDWPSDFHLAEDTWRSTRNGVPRTMMVDDVR